MRTAILPLLLLSAIACPAFAQQPANSGTFILHKFAKANGREDYSIQRKDTACTLTSHFLFTDRGAKVPLESTFVNRCEDGAPVSYIAKGQASRLATMDDRVDFADEKITLSQNGKSQTLTPAGPWFITDGYSPVAMQEQMMRWWLAHSRPPEFTVYPSTAKVHIRPAATLTIAGRPARGYT
ncbi:MAG TPA: amidohydrolase, partial [Acidobacteriaceae bacterium]